MVIDKKVNHLPVLTWNRLDFNAAVLKADITVDGKEYLQETALPQGMEYKGSLSMEELEALFEREGIQLTREAVVAGKYPMYMEQAMPTGMGKATDELLKEAGVATKIYEVAEGAKIREPVKFSYQYPEGAASLDSIFLHVKKGAELTLIQLFKGEGQQGFVGSTTRVYLEEGAKLHLIKAQFLPEGFVFYDDMGTKNMYRSELKYTQIELGAGRAYTGVNVDQWGDASLFQSDMGYMVAEGNFLDFNYVNTFRGKKTRGVMRFKGILQEHAKKISRETLDFRQNCVDAEGDEQEDVLVLGDDIVNKANPMILGEEEKVSGRHAVTIGRLSPEMLFYMQTRGIDTARAQELMVRASMDAVAGTVPDKEIRCAVCNYMDAKFGSGEECEL